MTDPTRIHVLSWDWREQPDLRHLAQLVEDLSGRRVVLREVATGSDQYALVIANVPLTDADVAGAYAAWENGDDQQ
jgi:hypothetical protein